MLIIVINVVVFLQEVAKGDVFLTTWAVIPGGAVASVQTGGVACMAHVGGAVFRALTARLFMDSRRAIAIG